MLAHQVDQLFNKFNDQLKREYHEAATSRHKALELFKRQRIGQKFLQTVISDIVLLQLKKSDRQLVIVRNHLPKQLMTLSKNSFLRKQILYQIFYEQYLYGLSINHKMYHTLRDISDNLINRFSQQPTVRIQELLPQHLMLTQPKVQVRVNNVQLYLTSEVMHPKTELTEFCHQLKIPQPNYIKSPEGKLFKINCQLLIPEEMRKHFKNGKYSAEATNLNGKQAAVDAARGLLLKLYGQNSEVWQRFKEIKLRKKIQT